MNNWFETHHVRTVFGWGPSKRWIVQGGPTIDARCTMHDAQLLLHDLVDTARKAGCVYVEIRCFEDYSVYREAFEAAGFVYQPHYDVLIDPAREVPDAKMRQIRRAINEGYTWRETCAEVDIKTWYGCLRRLYWGKLHRPLPSLSFFKDLINNKGCKLLVVEAPNPKPLSPKRARGVIVGGVLLAVEEDKRKAYEWYICGQVMSTWAAIEWCRHNEVKCFDTMGAGRPGVPYGVRDFKLQMGGELKEYGRYRCVLKPFWYRLGCMVMNR